MTESVTALKQLLGDAGRYITHNFQLTLGAIISFKAGLNRKIREGSRIVITSDVEIGLSKVCADWIDEQAPVMICDAEMKSEDTQSNKFSYDLVNCSEIINGGVLTSCPLSI